MRLKQQFKNFAPFPKCTTKIDGTTIHDAEDLDLVMLMSNLLEYNSNYFGKAGIYCKGEATIFNNNILNTNNFKSFMCKAKILGNTNEDGLDGSLKNATIADH